MRKHFANQAEVEAELTKLREQGCDVREFYHIYISTEGVEVYWEYWVYPPRDPKPQHRICSASRNGG